MKFMKLFQVECKRLLQAPTTWFFFLLASFCPLLGYKAISYIAVATVTDQYLANPFWIGGLACSFLLSILALYTYHRVPKNQMEHILYSVVSPVKLHVIQTFSLFLLGWIWTILIALIYLPYTKTMTANSFSLKEYGTFFFIFYGMTIALMLMMTAFLYNLTNHVDASAIGVALLVLLGLSSWKQLSYLSYLSFVDCCFSSDFGNDSIYRMLSYSRFLWLCIFCGMWLMSLLSIRTREKKWLGSILCNLCKGYLLVPGLLLLGAGGLLFLKQPYIELDGIENYAELETYDESGNYVESQTSDASKNYVESETNDTSKNNVESQTNDESDSNTYDESDTVAGSDTDHVSEDVDTSGGMMAYTYSDKETSSSQTLTHTDIDLHFDCHKGTMTGNATFSLENLSETEQECTLSTALGCEIQSITINDIPTSFIKGNKPDLYSGNNFTFILPATKNLTVRIAYKQTPKMAADGLVNPFCEITPEYIFPTTLVPGFTDVNTDSATYSCNATLPKEMELIVEGIATKQKQANQKGLASWQLHGEGASPFFIAGNYVKLPIQNVDFPVVFYYGKNHQEEFEKLNIEQLLQDTIHYCCDHYGVLPFTEEYPLNIVMTSAHMMGGAAGSNLSYMGESFFSSINLNDQQRGANAREVIAHEIIHQWWGMQAFIMDDEDCCWTPEAFTCYATSRLMEDLYGKSYAEKYYVEKWQKDYQNLQNHFYMQHPQYQSLLSTFDYSQLENLIDTTNVYSMGPLKLKLAEQLVGGEEQMDAVLQNLFEKCQSMELPYITEQDFIDACNLSETQLQLEGENAL